MSKLDQERLVYAHQALESLRRGEQPLGGEYRAVLEIGRAGLVEARSEIERFLTNDSGDGVRELALLTLTRNFGIQEHWETARQWLEHEKSSYARATASSALMYLRKNTSDVYTLKLLAPIVQDTNEPHSLRLSAYCAMRGILAYNQREQFDMLTPDFDLDRDADWKMVASYLSSSGKS